MSLRGASDRGSATVWVMGLACTLLLAAAVATMLAAAALSRHRAGGAADAAALAAAAVVLDGDEVACAAARRIAAADGARLVGCRVDDGRVSVVAELDPPAMLAWGPPVRARARAELIREIGVNPHNP